jgi:hypothetical protein
MYLVKLVISDSFCITFFMPRSMFKTVKNKLLNTITACPKLVTLGIGLAVIFVIRTAIGLVDHQSVFATNTNNRENVAVSKY